MVSKVFHVFFFDQSTGEVAKTGQIVGVPTIEIGRKYGLKNDKKKAPEYRKNTDIQGQFGCYALCVTLSQFQSLQHFTW